MRLERPTRVALALALAVGLPIAACATTPPTPTPPLVASGAAPASSSTSPPVVASSSAPPAASSAPVAEPESPCPKGMIFVDGTFCDQVERECLRKEENKPNHITLCHKFREKTVCKGKESKRAFCIDEYEYPNQKGAHPPWMVSWFDAEATCGSLGKRLCLESEWVTACEGPDHTPFPYGWERKNTACNIDNQYVNVHLKELYSSNREVADRELSRLDQSVPSGAMEECKSGYGVRDMTGNFDEWVTRDSKPGAKDKSKWAGLKGGAWGHVRNACRPMTVSHPPDFTYYFVSFRCCTDAKGHPAYQVPDGVPKAPKVEPANKARIPTPTNPPGPSKVKVKPEN